MDPPLNYYEPWECPQKSTGVRGAGHKWFTEQKPTLEDAARSCAILAYLADALDETPLTKDVIDAVSFYVWAARDANANDTGLVPVVDAEPAFAPFRQREELKPTATVAQRKEVLLRGR